MKQRGLCRAGALVALVFSIGAEAQDRRLEESDLASLAWRSVGPANMSGRVSTIALVPGDAKSFYVGHGTGGLWKTTNRGTTFTPLFDQAETSSIGAVEVVNAAASWAGWDNAVTPEERERLGRGRVVWVGTGEGNGRNSSSWGNGVYRSVDGGATFTHLGLSDSHDIPSIAAHPDDPDVCFIAALGHLWGPNEMRGIYRTRDGGESWDHVLAIDEHTGACDVVLHPTDPDIVYAAMYTRRRTIHSFQSGGVDGGIYRSTDGGDSWSKVTDGLPTQTGRIGLGVTAADPALVYAVIESDDAGLVGDAFADMSRAGGIFRSEDSGVTWERMSEFTPRSFYFSRIVPHPIERDQIYILGWEVYVSHDGGRTFRAGVANVPHVDFHAMVIDPDDPTHMLTGSDGGLYVSHDAGTTWDFHNHLALGQFYNIAVDDSEPYRIGGGLQDNGSWIGTSDSGVEDAGDFMGRAGGITNAEWRFVMGGDGFHVAFDPIDPNVVYAEWQGGNISRLHLDTGENFVIRPQAKEGEARLRFNWNAPFFVSPHDPTVLYLGGNHVYRLEDRGDRWTRISPDLTAADPATIQTVGSEAETGATLVSLAESPLQAGILWAGSDDGRIHVSDDGGASWRDVTPDVVDGRYIACIETSHHDAQGAFVAIDGHRSDRFEPEVLRSDDLGVTWISIAGDLPATAPPETIRQDPTNPEVLFTGTEHAAYVTINGGTSWVRLNGETLPTVPVDDLAVQRTEMDLVAGTHGRSIWILDDVSSLSQLTPEIVRSEFFLFQPMPGRPQHRGPYGGLWGDRMFVAQNPVVGAVVSYWIRDHTSTPVSIEILDENSHVVRKIDGTNARGLNRVTWDMQADARQRLNTPNSMAQFVSPGVYTAKVRHGEHTSEVQLEIMPVRRGAARQ